MDEHVVGVTGIRVHSAKNRGDEMTDGFRSIGIGNVDGPESGIFPGAEDNIPFDHSFDVMNAEPSPRSVRRTEAIRR